MWKPGVLFIIVAIEGACAQATMSLFCDFVHDVIFDIYQCIIHDVTVLDPTDEVMFSGFHVPHKTNYNVNAVLIYNSETPFIFPQLFTTFPNLRNLTIENSKLEKINIPPEAKLEYLHLNRNNISTIQSNSFRNQTELIELLITNSRVKFIAEDAFTDLHGLMLLSLMGNEIQTLATRTLAPLTKLVFISFTENLLTTIDEDTFSENTDLKDIMLGKNRIDYIHPKAFENLRNLLYIFLEKNMCVTEKLDARTDDKKNDMRKSLQTCFSNYGKKPVTTKYIKIQCGGTITISGEYGHWNTL